MTGTLLSRYKNGAHEATWRQLRRSRVLDAAARKQALEVARATMAIVARNADLVAGRLRALGWRALSGELRDRPVAADRKVMASVERFTGAPLPPSLQAFWEVVGGVDFVWDYERGAPPDLLGVYLPIEETDPLNISPARSVKYLIEEWRDRREMDPDSTDSWSLDLAPDALHKGNISGGAPYGICVPFAGADPVFGGEPHELPFVDYLRLCFRNGGFPGLEGHGRRKGVRALIAHLTEGLRPF